MTRTSFRSQYHYHKNDLNPFFSCTLSKTFSLSPLHVEKVMLEIYSSVHKHIISRITPHSFISETRLHEQIPLNSFVSEQNFENFQFSYKPRPLRIDPYDLNCHLSDVTFEIFSQDGSTFHIQQNHIIPYYPKETLTYPHITNINTLSININLDLVSCQGEDLYSNFDSFPSNYETSQKIFTDLAFSF